MFLIGAKNAPFPLPLWFHTVTKRRAISRDDNSVTLEAWQIKGHSWPGGKAAAFALWIGNLASLFLPER
ncbi:hypothetical protein [Dryocola sp. BD613]|uniref:hypothetical protein n=1 Tax=Dryocola sp. BD613 TaxID=3133272 RepID=UPI003F50C7D2